MSTGGLVAVVAALLVAAAIGIALRSRDGRMRTGGGTSGGWALGGQPPRGPEKVLLLQLSSPVCTSCRQTAAVLADLAAGRPGVVHREIDVADHPEVAAALHVMRTPTVVAFDRAGVELMRVSGVPRAADLDAVVAAELDRV